MSVDDRIYFRTSLQYTCVIDGFNRWVACGIAFNIHPASIEVNHNHFIGGKPSLECSAGSDPNGIVPARPPPPQISSPSRYQTPPTKILKCLQHTPLPPHAL